MFNKTIELLLNVRSGVQHLADKLDFVEGKLPDQDSSDDLANQAKDQIKFSSQRFKTFRFQVKNFLTSTKINFQHSFEGYFFIKMAMTDYPNISISVYVLHNKRLLL